MLAWASLKTTVVNNTRIAAIKGSKQCKYKQSEKRKGKEKNSAITPITAYYTNMSSRVQTPAKDSEVKESGSGYRLRNHSYSESIKGNPLSHKGNVKDAISEEEEDERPVRNTVHEARGSQEDLDDMGSIEDLLPPKELLKRDEFDKKNTANKLDMVLDAVNHIYVQHAKAEAKIRSLEFAVFDEDSGILPQIKNVVDHAKGSENRVDVLTKEMVELRTELDITRGIVHKQSKQITALKAKQVDLIARSMADNVTISGIQQDKPDVDSKTLVLNFLEEELEIELDSDEEISAAHRIGAPTKNSQRPIVFRCPTTLKKKIFQNTTKLAGKAFSVNQQVPDSLAEQKREIRQKIKQVQRLEQNKEDHQKSAFLVRNNKLYINGQLQRKKLFPPSVDQLFVNDTEAKNMDKIKFVHSKPKSVSSSSFMAAACVVENMDQVHLAYKRLFRENPSADHISAATIIAGEHHYQDDSEFGAGYRILNVIRSSKLEGIAVFVVRLYGGEHVGPARFNAIKEVAEEALLKLA